MKTLRFNVPVITDDWTATLPQDKTLLNNSYFIGYTFSFADPLNENGINFFKKYNQVYKTRPLINAVQSYDMIHMLDIAIRNSNSTSPRDIAQYLTNNLGQYSGVGGNISLNKDCEAQRDISIGHVVDGEIKLMQ